jgi:hypothetical protein
MDMPQIATEVDTNRDESIMLRDTSTFLLAFSAVARRTCHFWLARAPFCSHGFLLDQFALLPLAVSCCKQFSRRASSNQKDFACVLFPIFFP